VLVEVDVQPPKQDTLPPFLDELHAYWVALKGDRWAPTWPEFRLPNLRPQIIPNILVMDVIPSPLDFTYRFWGTANTTNLGYDLTGKSVWANPAFGEKVFNECRRIVDERRPLVFASKVTREDGMCRQYERIRLPISNDGENVTQIASTIYLEEKLGDIFNED